jgi:Protein of unknown function, DUF481
MLSQYRLKRWTVVLTLCTKRPPRRRFLPQRHKGAKKTPLETRQRRVFASLRLCGKLFVQTLLLALLIASSSISWAKRSDDVVILRNGDRMTGQIKGLQYGELRFKASYMADAVRLDWSKVERLESKDRYHIYLTDGKLFIESFNLIAADDDNFQIGNGHDAFRVRQMAVLRIAPIEPSFLKQLEGTVDFGFSFTSGNDQYTTQLAASTTYRSGTHSVTASVESVFSGQTEGSSLTRNQFTLDYRKQISPKWYVGSLLDFLRSDQQSLALRTTAAGFIGRNVHQTERTRISVFGGLAGTREKYTSDAGQPRATNADAITGIDFITYRFKTTDIRSRLNVFPSLTIPGRLRLQATSDLRIEVFKDLYWGFHIYENFDSKPPLTANKNDLGVSTSLGWKF